MLFEFQIISVCPIKLLSVGTVLFRIRELARAHGGLGVDPAIAALEDHGCICK